jgi:hypothetical protein
VGVASTVEALEAAGSTAEVEDFAAAASAAEGSAETAEDLGVIAVDTAHIAEGSEAIAAVGVPSRAAARMVDPEDSLALMGGATDPVLADMGRAGRTGEVSGDGPTRDSAHQGREVMLE